MGAHDNGGPAWPNAATATTAVFNGVERPAEVLHQPGMSLRGWFAGQALAGILAGGFGDTVPHDDIAGGSEAAFYAYQYADAMLRERANAEGQS